MLNPLLLSPKSIVVVGGSEDLHKPGGSVLKNLKTHNYKGTLYVVNPKADNVQGEKTYKSIEELPDVDLAILAIPAKLCVETVRVLCNKKGCGGIIILSAGFGESSKEGGKYEKEIVDIVNNAGASLIGPNCVGAVTPEYAGIFSKPVPRLSALGADLISGSGATIVFILEAASKLGLHFSSLFSVGNSAQLGVEDILEHLDETYVHGKSSPVKMLYIESINNPQKFLKHSASLVKKGAQIVAIKAGYSDVGSRAATSHTGALASPDKAVNALFRKAGIVRCYSRSEIVTVAAAMMLPTPKGKRMGIVTHAGGPAVMLADALCSHGISIPHFEGKKAEELLSKLYIGSAVGNPVDILATGTPEHLSEAIDACERDFDVDAITVIFGNPGLGDIYGACDVILKKQKSCKIPIFPVFTSIVNAKDEIEEFQNKGGISFSDEVIFGEAISKIMNRPAPIFDTNLPPVDIKLIREIISQSSNGYLPPEKVMLLLDAAGINRVKEYVAQNCEEAKKAAVDIGWPVAMKVIGPVHKSDVGGVVLNVSDEHTLTMEFERMSKIEGVVGIQLQPMLSGTEVFIGAKKEDRFGSLVMCGMGGIYIEVLKDISSGLSPVSQTEATEMIHSLECYKMIQGTRGQEGVNEVVFNETIRRVSALCQAAPEIYEMDINPLLGNEKSLTAVDTRIRIEKDV